MCFANQWQTQILKKVFSRYDEWVVRNFFLEVPRSVCDAERCCSFDGSNFLVDGEACVRPSSCPSLHNYLKKLLLTACDLREDHLDLVVHWELKIVLQRHLTSRYEIRKYAEQVAETLYFDGNNFANAS